MILPYILHGHIPFTHRIHRPHLDHFLDAKLKAALELLSADVDSLAAHFIARIIFNASPLSECFVGYDTPTECRCGRAKLHFEY